VGIEQEEGGIDIEKEIETEEEREEKEKEKEEEEGQEREQEQKRGEYHPPLRSHKQFTLCSWEEEDETDGEEEERYGANIDRYVQDQ
jgi:hypothetical protein